MEWLVWIDAPFIRIGKAINYCNSYIRVEQLYQYNFYNSSMIYPAFEGEISNDVYSNQHQKMFNNREDGEEFFNFLKSELVSVYEDFEELRNKIKELETIMKSKLSMDLKFVFDEKWKNEQRFNKLKVMLDEEV